MTVKEAYGFFIKKYPDKKTCVISNLEDVFLISVGSSGDFIDDTYIIDKKTLMIKEINTMDFSKLINRYSDEDLDKIEMVRFD